MEQMEEDRVSEENMESFRETQEYKEFLRWKKAKARKPRFRDVKKKRK